MGNKAKTQAALGSLTERVDQLRTLVPGWLGTGSLAPREDHLNRVGEFFVKFLHLRPDLFPHLCPDGDGNLSAEWRIGTQEISAHFDLRENEIWLHAYRPTKEDRELTLAFNAPGVEELVIKFIGEPQGH